MTGVDVIIPTFKPDRKLEIIVERLRKQTVVPNNIIIVNTIPRPIRKHVKGSIIDFTPRPEKLDSLCIKGANDELISFENDSEDGRISIFNITQDEFDHGATRDYGIAMSDAQFVVLLNQDSIPLDKRLVEKLLEPFEDKSVVCTYGRQFCDEFATDIERYAKNLYFPNTSFVKSGADIKNMGMRTYFCSNACAAYRREIYSDLGGFEVRTIFNEDIIFGAKIIVNGYKIAYASGARVRYHRSYKLKQLLQKNFDLGVLSRQYRSLFKIAKPVPENSVILKKLVVYLVKSGNITKLPEVLLYDMFEGLGYSMGYNYEKIPAILIRRLSLNKEYWRRNLR